MESSILITIGLGICQIEKSHFSCHWFSMIPESLVNTFVCNINEYMIGLNSLLLSDTIWHHRESMKKCYLSQCLLLISEVLWHSPDLMILYRVPKVSILCMSFTITNLRLQPFLPGVNAWIIQHRAKHVGSVWCYYSFYGNRLVTKMKVLEVLLSINQLSFARD